MSQCTTMEESGVIFHLHSLIFPLEYIVTPQHVYTALKTKLDFLLRILIVSQHDISKAS